MEMRVVPHALATSRRLHKSSEARRRRSDLWQKERTVTRAFRISEPAIEKLQEDAKEQGVSLNTLVNQLFLSYANFDHYVQKLHMIKISAPTARFIVQGSPDETVAEAGRYAAGDIHKIFILAKHGEISLGGALEFLRDLSVYGKWFEYNQVDHEGKHTITLMHELGPKWSLFLSSYVQTLFDGIGIRPRLSSTDASVTFDLESSHLPER